MTKLENAQARRYVIDIMDGMVPSDALYNAIMDVAGKHGFLKDPNFNNFLALATDIRKLRAEG